MPTPVDTLYNSEFLDALGVDEGKKRAIAEIEKLKSRQR